MKTFAIPALILMLGVISCKDTKTRKPEKTAASPAEAASRKLVKINGEYGMLLPDYMTRTEGMNKDASLQYWSILKRMYIVVVDESRDTLLMRMKDQKIWQQDKDMATNLAELQLNSPTAQLRTAGYPMAHEAISGLPAVTAEADAHMQGVTQDFHYYFGFVDGGANGKVYTIMSWVYQNDTAKNGDACRQMVQSFRLLDPAAHG